MSAHLQLKKRDMEDFRDNPTSTPTCPSNSDNLDRKPLRELLKIVIGCWGVTLHSR